MRIVRFTKASVSNCTTLAVVNLAIILTVFAVSFTIGWGVYFLSLGRCENSPNCTSAIRMLSLMAEWAILVA
jgi:hypothetical protein